MPTKKKRPRIVALGSNTSGINDWNSGVKNLREGSFAGTAISK